MSNFKRTHLGVLYLGMQFLCGFNMNDWNRTSVRVSGMPPDKVLEYLLGQCWKKSSCPAGSGDYLLTAVESVANTFLGETVLQRTDVQAVVQARPSSAAAARCTPQRQTRPVQSALLSITRPTLPRLSLLGVSKRRRRGP